MDIQEIISLWARVKDEHGGFHLEPISLEEAQRAINNMLKQVHHGCLDIRPILRHMREGLAIGEKIIGEDKKGRN